MSEYTHRVTIGVPEHLIDQANHLACIVGESASDINTFSGCGWQDSEGNPYAAASTVVKPVFLEAVSGLPETPEHAIGVADPYLAQQALDTLNQPGGIQMIVDVEPFMALEEMGLKPLEQLDDLFVDARER